MNHVLSNTSILYFGTPVALISTLNEDGSANLMPMSSVFWLGHSCLLGMGIGSKTPQNLIRTGECVINLPSSEMADCVDRIARTTGSNPVPESKIQKGYRFVKDKFHLAGLTEEPSLDVKPPRALECPVQLEGRLKASHEFAGDAAFPAGSIGYYEVEIVKIHLAETILLNGQPNRVDPDKWRPLIMSFAHFYGLTDRVHGSELAKIDERLYSMSSS